MKRLSVRRVAGAGRGVCVDRLTADERRGRRAGSGESGRTTLWELGVLALLGVALWWVAVNWPFGRGESAKAVVESELDAALDPAEKSERTNIYVQIGSNGMEALDPRWLAELEDEAWMADGEVRTVTSGTNIFILHTRRLNGTNLTVVTQIVQDPTNYTETPQMWYVNYHQDDVPPRRSWRLTWWATALLAMGSFAGGYGCGRWAEAGWWHRKRGEIE